MTKKRPPPNPPKPLAPPQHINETRQEPYPSEHREDQRDVPMKDLPPRPVKK
jgi:hypothetical protein